MHIRYPNQLPQTANRATEAFVRHGYEALDDPSAVLPTTFGTVDLGVFRENLRATRRNAPEAVLMPVLKSDGMGLGAAMLARECFAHGSSVVAISDLAEAQQLVNFGIDAKKLFCLYPSMPWEYASLVSLGVECSVQSLSDVEAVARASQSVQSLKTGVAPVAVHLNVNTGFNRYGAGLEESRAIVERISRLPDLKLEGVFTHFSDPANDAEYTRCQLNRFRDVLRALKDSGVSVPMIHVANSAALMHFPEVAKPSTYADISPESKVGIRAGSTLLGFTEHHGKGLEQAMDTAEERCGKLILTSLVSHVASFFHKESLIVGDNIGYEGVGKIQPGKHLATIPVGWGATGINFRESEANVLIGKERARVVGLTSAAAVIAETKEPHKVGERAILLGSNGYSAIEPSEFLKATGDALLEQVVTRIGSRVPMVYLNGSGPK